MASGPIKFQASDDKLRHGRAAEDESLVYVRAAYLRPGSAWSDLAARPPASQLARNRLGRRASLIIRAGARARALDQFYLHS